MTRIDRRRLGALAGAALALRALPGRAQGAGGALAHIRESGVATVGTEAAFPPSSSWTTAARSWATARTSSTW